MVLEQGVNDASKKAYHTPLFVMVLLCVWVLIGIVLEEYTHSEILWLFVANVIVAVFITPPILFRMYIRRLEREITLLTDLYAKEGIRFNIDGDCNSLTNYGVCFRKKKRMLSVIVTIVGAVEAEMV